MNPEKLLVPIWEEAEVDTEYQQALLETISKLDLTGKFEQSPLLFCKMLGGDLMIGTRVALAWNLLCLAGRILDDIQDKDLSMDVEHGPSKLNISTGLLFSSNQLIITTKFESLETKFVIQEITNRLLLMLTSGQHLDLNTQTPTLSRALTIAKNKTGRLAELGCWLGARVATNSLNDLNAARKFGTTSGMMAQIKDDLMDLWNHNNAKNDLENRRYGSIPLSYAIDNLSDKEGLRILQGKLSVEQVREKIINSGAPIYLAVQSKIYHSQALEALNQFSDKDPMNQYLPFLTSLLDSLTIAS